MPPFIVTLGGMTVWRGHADPQRWCPDQAASTLAFAGGDARILGIPVPVLVFFIVAVAGYVVLRYTRYGRQVYAVGGNPEAARLSGLSVSFVVCSVYVITGFLTGLAGFLLSARLARPRRSPAWATSCG